MKVLNEKDASDVEMLTYGMTVINKTLNGVSDQVSTIFLDRIFVRSFANLLLVYLNG